MQRTCVTILAFFVAFNLQQVCHFRDTIFSLEVATFLATNATEQNKRLHHGGNYTLWYPPIISAASKLEEHQELVASDKPRKICNHPMECRLELVHIPKTGGTAIENAGEGGNVTWGVCHFGWVMPWSSPPLCKQPGIYANQNDVAKLDKPLFQQVSPWHLPPRYFDYLTNADGNTPHVLINSELHSTFSHNPYNNVTLFCVVRNPYERLISEFFMRLGGTNPTQLNQYITEKLWRQKAFVNATPIGFQGENLVVHNDYLQSDGHYIPQVDFAFDANGRQRVHHVLHYESLSQDFAALTELYGYTGVTLAKKKAGVAFTSSHKTMNVSHLSRETIRLVNQVYDEDFKAFGYQKVNADEHR